MASQKIQRHNSATSWTRLASQLEVDQAVEGMRLREGGLFKRQPCSIGAVGRNHGWHTYAFCGAQSEGKEEGGGVRAKPGVLLSVLFLCGERSLYKDLPPLKTHPQREPAWALIVTSPEGHL